MIDLREASLGQITGGRLVARGAPLAGVLVEWPPAAALTDHSGAFSLCTGPCRMGINRRSGPFLHVTVDGMSFSLLPPPESGLGPARVERDWQLGDQQLELRAVDAEGLALTAKVELTCYETDGGVGSVVRVHETRMVPREGLMLNWLPAGKYLAKVRFASGATIDTRFELPAQEPLVLREPSCGSLEVTLTSDDGSTVANRTISVREWVGDGAAPADDAAFLKRAGERAIATDGHGIVRLSGLRGPEVIVQLLAGHAESIWVGEAVATRRVRIEPGVEQKLSLAIR
jgi:hypothetical protein